MNSKLNSIWLEWRAKVPTGVPNPSNAYHLTFLKELCLEQGIDKDIIDNVILVLEKDDDKYQSVGYGKYKLKKDIGPDGKGKEGSPTFEKDDTGNYVKVGGDEKDDEKPEDKPEPMKIDPEGGFGKEDDEEKEGDGRNISDENQKIINDFEKRVSDRRDFLNPNQQKLVDEALDKVKTLYDDDASEDEQREAAQWLVDNAGFATNENRKKAYMNKLGGNRKIISGDAGTKKSENLVAKVSSLVEIKTFDAKSVKQGFTTAAKPDLGKENEVKPSQDENVARYFESHPILQKIRPGLHGLFGVKGEDGKVKMPSSEHSRDYLEQSINNPALQNTIDFAKEQVKAGNVDKGVLTALESHQKTMTNILENYEIPSEEASQAIADSYNSLMIGLQKSDDEIANSIMKQLAENNLYEQELAAGEEVYLPSAGNFPAGDKIKGGTLEKVSLISCKFGKEGRIYGCPANSKTICELHQDESKQNNQGQYLGEDGYTLLINDNLIKGKDKGETKSKTKNFIEETLNEVNLGDTFSEEEIIKISTITADYMEEIDRIKKEVSDANPPDKKAYWELFSQKLDEIEGDYKQRLGEVVTVEHAAALIGENNAKNLVQKGGVKVEALMSAIEIANNIRTNESLNDLEHNKQFYDENGEPNFVTSKGTQNPDDYSITFRTKRTAGRTGGGCQLSFTGDGKPAPVDLTDDGEVIDAKTGEVKEV